MYDLWFGDCVVVGCVTRSPELVQVYIQGPGRTSTFLHSASTVSYEEDLGLGSAMNTDQFRISWRSRRSTDDHRCRVHSKSGFSAFDRSAGNFINHCGSAVHQYFELSGQAHLNIMLRDLS